MRNFSFVKQDKVDLKNFCKSTHRTKKPNIVNLRMETCSGWVGDFQQALTGDNNTGTSDFMYHTNSTMR